MSSSEADKENYKKVFTEFKDLIDNLPSSLPHGSSDGRIAKYFPKAPKIDDEGPWYTFNTAWDRAFQVPEEEKRQLLTSGPDGLARIISFVEVIVACPAIYNGNSIFLVADRLKKFINYVRNELPDLPAFKQKKNQSTSKNIAPRKPKAVFSKQAAKKGALKKPKKREIAQNDPSTLVSSEDEDFQLDLGDELSLSESPSADESVATSPGKTTKKRKKRSKQKSSSKKAKKAPLSGTSGSEESSDNDDAEVVPVRQGRQPVKGVWAFSQFTPHAATSKAKPVWKWICNHCDVFRTSPRTKGCTIYADETIPRPPSSNFITHMEKCKNIPTSLLFENKGRSTLNMDEGETLGGKTPRNMMGSFIQKGIESPAKEVTRKGFREHLVKGIFEDDLPFSFCEKDGMKKMFSYILPAGFTLPSHNTVRCDLDRLYDVLNGVLNQKLENNSSKIAIAQDVWTSKNSVYAFAGLVGFWINDDWEIEEHILDLLPLDGDHSGGACGKEIFLALHRRKIVSKLSACAADNTSSNGVTNRAISKRIAKKRKVTIHAGNMQVGCAGHVINLSSQDILHVVGSAPSTDDIDLYEQTRQYPLAYDAAKDPVVAEEQKKAQEELNTDIAREIEIVMAPVSDSDSDAEDEQWEDVEGETTARKKSPKKLSAVDKLHAVVVHILRSDIRRMHMRRLIRQLCDATAKHLVLIRSMAIRWNTTYAEIQRAIKLRPAVNQFIDQLDSQLSGKKKAAATKLKQKWYLSPSDWGTLSRLCEILSVLNDATFELSKAGEPTICKTLLLYKHIETHFRKHIEEIEAAWEADPDNIKGALEAGLAKLILHRDKALRSDYPLLGAVLHPSLRLDYFERNWDEGLAKRARILLEHLYAEYAEDAHTNQQGSSPSASTPTSQATSRASSIFDTAINVSLPTRANILTELALYFSGAFPCRDNNALAWWKKHRDDFPILSRIARDVLAIPGVSISVERLFSSSKHTLSDTRSSLTAVSASKTIVVKEWLKRGLGDGVDYLDNVSIRTK